MNISLSNIAAVKVFARTALNEKSVVERRPNLRK
jgi:hypothetical protein